jgi:hypothetical protein
VAKGFAISVVFMIAVPFAMIAAGGGAMWWLSKRAEVVSLQIQQSQANTNRVKPDGECHVGSESQVDDKSGD